LILSWNGIANGNIAQVATAQVFETKDSAIGKHNTDQPWLPAAIIALGRLSWHNSIMK